METAAKRIPFHKAHITDDEIQAVTDALRSGWLTMGPKTIEFEGQFSEAVGVQHAISLNSATAALHLALKSIGLSSGDEVIMPTTTFISAAEVVSHFNAIPVLCDVEESTHNIDVTKIEALITPKTKAIIPVHFAGQPCDLHELQDIAQKYGLVIIEDAAHAFPSTYNQQPIGSICDITCFSFYATKTLTTGEGGMATTNNDEYAQNIKTNRLHGISRDAWDRYSEKGHWFYEVVDNGFKFNSTDLNAAIGLEQLKKQNRLLKEREAIADRYSKALSTTPLKLPTIKANRTTSWHLYVVKTPDRDRLIDHLKSLGIGTSVHFIPTHAQPFYQKKYGYRTSDYPVAQSIFEQTLSLPIYPGLSESDVDYITEAIHRFFSD